MSSLFEFVHKDASSRVNLNMYISRVESSLFKYVHKSSRVESSRFEFEQEDVSSRVDLNLNIKTRRIESI